MQNFIGKAHLAAMLLAAGLAMLVAASPTMANNDERAEIRERLRQRYSTLLALQNQGRVGEVYTGLVEAVQPNYLSERVDRDNPQSPTIQQFIGEENRDRNRLYALIAEQENTSAARVAERSAVLHFRAARPEHFLKDRDNQWRRKRDRSQ